MTSGAVKNRGLWLRILNVDIGEWGLVRRLMILQFLQGAGIAFFFTGTFATFLHEQPITELPRVMILSSALLWVSGYLYSLAEQKLANNRLTLAVTTFMLLSILFFRLAHNVRPGYGIHYWMMAWFHVLYLLNSLQFWGLVAPLFDLRQSKRLFGLISSGDIPAKFVGYTLASLAANLIGTINMLYISAACMAISLPFLADLNSATQKTRHPGHTGKVRELHNQHPKKAEGLAKLIRDFTKISFIRNIALTSMLAFCSLLMINYGFYAEVKHRSLENRDLAAFIAGFMAATRLLAMIAKMIFTGRVMSHMGLRRTLLITPLVMIALMAATVIMQMFETGENGIFYLFGAAFILVEVCRTVFNSPGLITLMQPLPVNERLRAHNIIKGIMDPFAFLLAGSILMAMINVRPYISLPLICYVVMVMGVAWITGIWLIKRQYLQILLRTIASRHFSMEEFSLKDELIQQAIRKKIATGSELEMISILKMLSSNSEKVPNDISENLLKHPSPKVRIEMLRLLARTPDGIPNNIYDDIAGMDPSEEVRAEAVKAIAKTAVAADRIERFTESGSPLIRKAALSGMLLNADPGVREESSIKLAEKIRGVKDERLLATAVLQDTRDDICHPLLHELLSDPDRQVKSSAILAVGKAADRNSVGKLVSMLPENGNTVLRALQHAGPEGISVIADAIISGKYSEWEEKMISLIGRLGGQDAQRELLRLLQKVPLRAEPIIRALNRSNHTADPETKQQMENMVRTFITHGVEVLYMQRMLGNQAETRLLKNSLDLEMEKIRDILLSLFGCMYDNVKMNRAKHGLESKVPGNMANALEIIELTVSNDAGRQFNAMFENTSLEHRCDALGMLLKDKRDLTLRDIITSILHDRPLTFNNWTKACSLYTAAKHRDSIDPETLEIFTRSENRMIRETAEYAMEIV